MARTGWHQTRLDLSERQEEVLRLIAEGRTNYEIAQQLDISLEGAKYHVREIMTKLGVDSREKAAGWWRQQRRPLVRLRRALGWWPLWAGVGATAALGVAGLVVFVALLNSGGEDTRAGASTSASATLTADNAQILVAIGNEPPAQSTGMRVFAADGSFDHTFPGFWSQPTWSPDGRFLAVFGPSDQDRELHLHILRRDGDPAHWKDRVASPTMGPFFGSSIYWSGDGSRLAILGPSVFVFDSQANLLQSFDLRAELSQLSFSGEAKWSPDGSSFAAITDRKLLIVHAGGQHELLSPPSASALGIQRLKRWTSDDTLIVLSGGGPPAPAFQEISVRLQPGAQAVWTALGTTSGDPDPAYAQVLEEISQSVTAQYPKAMMNAGPTADGRGIANTVMPSIDSPGLQHVFAIVRFDGKDTRVELGASESTIQIGRTYDVVIVPKE